MIPHSYGLGSYLFKVGDGSVWAKALMLMSWDVEDEDLDLVDLLSSHLSDADCLFGSLEASSHPALSSWPSKRLFVSLSTPNANADVCCTAR